MAYVSAAEGYRSPGFNTGGFADLTAPGDIQPNRMFHADELWTYEIGARLVAPDNRWMLAMTVFRNEWSNIQTDDFLVHDFVFTGNAGDSSGYGAEFHATFEPDEHWLFRANAMVNEPEIVRPDPTFPIGPDAVLPGTTEWSGSFSTAYRSAAQLLGRNGNLSIALLGDFAGPSSLLLGTGSEIGSRAEFDLRAGFRTSSWQLSAYVTNLFDSNDPSFSNGNPYQAGQKEMTTPLRPRTIGFRVSKSIQ